MDTRRLIAFGKNSFVVSVPKEWVEANKLKKGAELFIEQKPSTLTLFSKKTAQAERVINVACDGKEPAELETELGCHYRAGYTMIIIEGKTLPRHAAAIRQYIHSLAGAEIVEQTRTRLVVKDLIDVEQVTLPTLVNRMDMMIRSVFHDALADERIEPALLEDRDYELYRTESLLARVVHNLLENPSLANVVGMSILHAHYADRMGWLLSRIGIDLRTSYGEMYEMPKEREARLRRMLQRLYTIYLSAMKAYAAGAAQEAVRTSNEIAQLWGEIGNAMRTVKERDEVIVLGNFRRMLKNFDAIVRLTVELSEPVGNVKGRKA